MKKFLLILVVGFLIVQANSVLADKANEAYTKDPAGKTNIIKETKNGGKVKIQDLNIEGKVITFTMLNKSKNQLSYNSAFKILNQDNSLAELPLKSAFTDDALLFKPNTKIRCQIDLDEYFSNVEPGKYILEKEIYDEKNNSYFDIRIKFVIE